MKPTAVLTDFNAVSFREVSINIAKLLAKEGVQTRLLNLTATRIPEQNIIFVGNVFHLSISYAQRFLPQKNLIFYAITEGIPILDGMSKKISENIHYITPSQYARQCLEQAGLTVEAVIPHGINLDCTCDVDFLNRIKNALPQPSKVPPANIMLCVAGNWKRKALDKLLIAYKTVEKIVKDAFLILHTGIGETNIVALQEMLMLKRFWFTNMWGVLPQGKLQSLYALCDYYVQPCFSEDTRILTKNGLKRIDEINLGDLVWTINPETEELELAPVENIFVGMYHGQMVHFKNKQVDLLVTPNHRVYYYSREGRKRKKSKLKVQHAEAFLQSNIRYYIPTTAKWNCECKEVIETRELYDHNYPVQFRIKHLPQFVKTSVLLELIGWYVSEGSIVDRKRNRCVIFSASNPTKRARIKYLVKELGLHPIDDNDQIKVYSVPLIEILRQCGQSAQTKTIPEWCLDFAPALLKSLYNGLMGGDGSVKGHHVLYYTTSDRLKDKFIELCLKLGYSVKIWRRKTNGSILKDKGRLRVIKPSESWMISIRTKHNKGTIKPWQGHIKKEPYEGIVWCVSTKNKTVFVERNGLICASGNSMVEGFGITYLEAFKWHKPVIGVDCPATNELVKDGYTGLLIPVIKTEDVVWQQRHAIRLHHFDVDALIDAMVLMSNPEVREKMAVNIEKEKQKYGLDVYKQFLKWLD